MIGIVNLFLYMYRFSVNIRRNRYRYFNHLPARCLYLNAPSTWLTKCLSLKSSRLFPYKKIEVY